MHSLTCMSVVVCNVRKPRPCNSYSRRRDRINSVLWRSYYKGGGGKFSAARICPGSGCDGIAQASTQLCNKGCPGGGGAGREHHSTTFYYDSASPRNKSTRCTTGEHGWNK